MAPRKNAKGGGGNSSSSGSGSGSGSPSTGSSGSSSSPGARRGQSPRRPGPGCGREPGGRCRSGLVIRPSLLSILSEAPACAGRGRAHRAGRRRSRIGPRGTLAPACRSTVRPFFAFLVEAGRRGLFIFSLQISGRLTLIQSQGK